MRNPPGNADRAIPTTRSLLGLADLDGRILSGNQAIGFVGHPPEKLLTLKPRGEPGHGYEVSHKILI